MPVITSVVPLIVVGVIALMLAIPLVWFTSPGRWLAPTRRSKVVVVALVVYAAVVFVAQLGAELIEAERLRGALNAQVHAP